MDSHQHPPHHEPPHSRRDSPSSKILPADGLRSIASAVMMMVGALFIAFSIAAFVIQSYPVDGESMETTLQNNDRLLVNKIPRTIARITHHAYVPHRGDIIVFNQSGLYDNSGNAEKQLIKRVIGLPGDRVVVKNGQITIYNKDDPAGINPDEAGTYHISTSSTNGNVDLVLDKDQLFVCGDNRLHSEDSRFFGPIQANSIVGKLVLRIVPLDKAQTF